MAVIRGFRHEVKGHGTKHSTDVDCLYFHFLDNVGSRILQLSTLGSEHRQSRPKVSQTFQIGVEGAAELRQILDQTFRGTHSYLSEEIAVPSQATPSVLPPSATEDAVDRFMAQAGLERVEDLSPQSRTGQRRVRARDVRPHIGGDWHIIDGTDAQVLDYAEIELDARSALFTHQRVAVLVDEISEELEQVLVGAHAVVVRTADLVRPSSRSREHASETTSCPGPAAASSSVVPWVEELFHSEVYLAQKARAGRATLTDEVVHAVISALYHRGWSGPIVAIESEAGLRTGTLRAALSHLRRLLNIDGYETLSLREETDLAIDESLLRQQFGLSSPADPGGDRL